MERRGLPRAVTDASVLERTVERFREAGVALPTFGELANPTTIPDRVTRALETVEPDAASNRVHAMLAHGAAASGGVHVSVMGAS